SLPSALSLRDALPILARESTSGEHLPATRVAVACCYSPSSSLTAAGPPRIHTGFPSSRAHRARPGTVCTTWKLRLGSVNGNRSRSEEHTSELQSRENL